MKNNLIISGFDERGKGFAMINGMKKVNKRFAVWIDDDGQYDNNEIPKLIDLNYDLVCGYRDWEDVPFKHRIANKLITHCFNAKFNTSFNDVCCGFVGFNMNFIKIFLDSYYGGGYDVDFKIKIIAVKNNMKIKQVPISVRYNKTSGNLRGIIMVANILYGIITEREWIKQ